MTFRDTIQRTECACEACQVGCRCMPGMLGVGDLERIEKYISEQTGIPYAELDPGTTRHFTEHFVASEGAKVGTWDGPNLRTFQIGTITPAQKPNGECVFFNDGKCGIHPVSPIGCSHVDTHMTKEQGDAVVHPALAEIGRDMTECGPYSRARAALVVAGKVARPRAERRAAFERLYAQATARLAPQAATNAPGILTSIAHL